MYRKTFQLKQHTPLIHFQHDQAGATLRATEVKPKLDRFIIEEIGWGQINKNGWAAPCGTEEYQALNYTMHIVAENPLHGRGHGGALTTMERNREGKLKPRSIYNSFFADMGKDDTSDFKHIAFHEKIKIRISTFSQSLLKAIELRIPRFLSKTNFGMRQHRGFGSFLSSKGHQGDEWSFFFGVKSHDQVYVLNYIDFVARTIRSGLNCFLDPMVNFTYNSEFYMKPLIFHYAASEGVEWEKKAIKKKFNQDIVALSPNKKADLKSRAEQTRKNYVQNIPHHEPSLWPLTIDRGSNQAIVRDILGLSTSQEWRSYRKIGTISKTSIRSNAPIERAPSPLTFKPVRASDGYLVYVYTAQPNSEYLGHPFKIVRSQGEGSLTLNIWKDFKIADFIDCYLNVATVEACIPDDKKRGRHDRLYQHLRALFYQIEQSVKYRKSLQAQS